ncbi:MAG: thiamine biosynthesis protein ThiS [Verrucomicrobiaceae bacterium TMED86]|nr:MAG: thiamine biosynthesis protein ThiS [Verrucomicrobiaceae bacterium TMED86]
MITLTINGEQQKAEKRLSLRSLLINLGLGEKPVVVELNRHALSPSEFEEKILNEGDELEIITIAAGG